MATYSSTQAIKSKSTNLPSTSAIEPKKHAILVNNNYFADILAIIMVFINLCSQPYPANRVFFDLPDVSRKDRNDSASRVT